MRLVEIMQMSFAIILDQIIAEFQQITFLQNKIVS